MEITGEIKPITYKLEKFFFITNKQKKTAYGIGGMGLNKS